MSQYYKYSILGVGKNVSYFFRYDMMSVLEMSSLGHTRPTMYRVSNNYA